MNQIHNHTNLCLIPKVDSPTSMTEFRPIALCNVFYKIISKILVNRLKLHLSGIISENQAAFIPGRMITDNIIIAQEVFHALKVRKRQANSYMALKTDITKAYDKLEWRFLEETMIHMGFDQRWIRWIMQCVSSVSFSVLINGSPQEHITPGRGIRQGDPLSPYLFILCAEVLSHMLNRATMSRKLQGIKISDRGPAITHADDSLFFTLANAKSCRTIKEILAKYEEASGQGVNLRKSSITFGSKVKPDVKRRMRNLLRIHNEGGGGKYLGMPEQFGRKKTEMFQYIIDKVKERTQGWNKNFLSPGGKEVLLKSVAMAMPVYSMNIFKLPNEICEEINGILAKFWWGTTEGKRGMHWFAWNRLSVPKKEGGLGFRDLEKFNLAMLGKQVWRILQHPQCLMARVLRNRYFYDVNILNATPKAKASYVWKSILQGRDLVRQGMRFVIGDGSLVDTWLDPWLPTHPPRAPMPIQSDTGSFKVRELLNANKNGWDEDKVRSLVVEDDVERILSLHICPAAVQDFLGWHYNKDGIYSVKSGYWLASHQENQIAHPIAGSSELKKKIWKLSTAPKIKHFLWKAISGSLPTGETLRIRHVSDHSICRRCCREEEYIHHIFFGCEYARATWRASGIPNPNLFDPYISLEDKIEAVCFLNTSLRTRHLRHLPLWIMWRLWKSRNMLLFQKKYIPLLKNLQYARQDAKEWMDSSDYLLSLSNTNRYGNDIFEEIDSNWKRPNHGWIKCNYDGSFLNSDSPSKAGWIIRDENGVYLGAGQAVGRRTLNALESELQAMIIAMQNCWSRGYRKVIFEGDNKEVSNLINGKSLNFQSLNWIREGISWSKRFEGATFKWIKRSSNKLADTLAKQRIPDNVSFVFHYYVPISIRNDLHTDHVNSRF